MIVISSTLGLNNLYCWAMSQNLPINNFDWIKDTSQFNENFIKIYNEESDKGYFNKAVIEYLENLHELHNEFTRKNKNWKSRKACSKITW